MIRWTLSLSGGVASTQTFTFREQDDGMTVKLVKDHENLWSIVKTDSLLEDYFHGSLGQMAFRRGVITLEAFVREVQVHPDQQHGDERSWYAFKLPRSRPKNRAVVLLRAGDSVSFKADSLKLSFTYDAGATKAEPERAFESDSELNVKGESKVGTEEVFKLEPEVEVKSSEPAREAVPLFGADGQQDSEPETDDEMPMPYAEAHRRTATPEKEQFSTARTVIQETPTAARTQKRSHSPINDEQDLLLVRPKSAEAMDLDISERVADYPDSMDQMTFPDILEVQREHAGAASKSKRKAQDAAESYASRESSVPSTESITGKRIKGSQASSVGPTARRLSSVVIDTSEKASPSPATTRQESTYTGPPPRILFSNTDIHNKLAAKKFFTSHKAAESGTLTSEGSNFLCVGVGEIRTTAKLLFSLVLEKTIVTDTWVHDSMKAGHLLKPEPYLPSALYSTKCLDRHGIFAGKTVYLTPALKKLYGDAGYNDTKYILELAGAKEVASKSLRELKADPSAIVIGLEAKDPDALGLARAGTRVFKKDLISSSIVQAQLLLDDEDLQLDFGEAEKNLSNAGKKRKTKQ